MCKNLEPTENKNRAELGVKALALAAGSGLAVALL